jgi:hypothetical protein
MTTYKSSGDTRRNVDAWRDSRTQNTPAWLVRPSQTKHIGDDAAELVAVEHDIGHRPMRTLQRRG